MLTNLQEDLLLKTPVFDVVRKKFKETQFEPVGLNCKPWVMIVAVDDNIANNPVTVFVEQTRWGLENKTIEFPCGTVEAEDFLAGINIDNIDETTIHTLGYHLFADKLELDKTVDFTKWTPAFLGQDIYDYGLAHAAVREFKEETGISILESDLHKLAEFNPNPAYFNNTMTIFYIKRSSLLEDFNNRSNQQLDKDEDCRVFTGRFKTYVSSIRKHAMGIAALFYIESADQIITQDTSLKTHSGPVLKLGGLDEIAELIKQ